jgi:FtsZ-binding cell division protein ZapB
MKKWDLDRKVDRAKETFDELIGEIESLEKQNAELEDEIENHIETIRELNEEIENLKK